MASQPGLNVTAVAPLYANGMPVDAVGQALEDSDGSARGGHVDYWASPERSAGSGVQEVLEISLSIDRLVNSVDLRVARYPCVVYVQYKPEGGDWQPLLEQRTGKVVQAQVTHSVPGVITGSAIIPAGSNISPQHAFPNHWEDLSFQCEPVTCKKIRLVIERIQNPNNPVDADQRPADYSVAVMDLDIGYRVSSKADLSSTSIGGRVVDPTQPPVVSNQDLLGSSVDYYLREYFAADLNWAALQAQAGVNAEDRADDSVWRCEPQPRADAVVPFYVDVRGPDGRAQVVDSFLVDPMTSGVQFNLYYSNDEHASEVSFAAVDEPLRVPALSERGSIIATSEGLLFGDGGDSLDIDNGLLHWDPVSPWWMGVQFQPQFSSDDVAARVIFDSPALRISYATGQWSVRINGSDFLVPSTDFVFNQSMIMVVGLNGTAGEVRVEHSTTTDMIVLSEAEPGDFRIGAGYGDIAGDVRINRLVIKQEALTDTNGEPSDIRMRAYTGGDGGGDLARRPTMLQTRSALLRIDPEFQGRAVGNDRVYGHQNPFGIRGGPGHIYETLSWTPVNREFRLYKGVIHFDEVAARYFKFEFTSLVPRPYASPETVTRVVNIFPHPPVLPPATNPRTLLRDEGLDTGGQTNTDLSNSIRFSDQRGVRARQTQDYQDYKPTEALFTRDAEASARLRDLAPVFGLEPWHQDSRIPRFPKDEPHVYNQVVVEHITKVAYFVGLKTLKALRTNLAAPVDTDEYLFMFNDDDLLVQDSGFPWLFDPVQGLFSGFSVTDFVRVASEPLQSRRNVRGVQFAALQTSPVQRLIDPDFRDPDMTHWEPYGGAQVDRLEDTSSGFGTTLRVRRQPEGAYWNYVESQYGTWDEIEALDPSPEAPTWDDITFLGTIALATGGVEGTQYVSLPIRGRVYAAARVYAPTPLTAPLHIQILGDNGEVLADQKTNSFQGQVLEWYASHTIGEGGAPPEYETWDEVMTGGPEWDDMESFGTWDQIAGIDEGFAGFSGNITVRVFQEGATIDEFFVDNISLFEDPIIWEFSNDGGTNWYPAYDIRNNPNGVLVFPGSEAEVLDQQHGTELCWRVSGYRADLHISALAIRPWYHSPGMGILPTGALEQAGPNRSPYDQFPATEDSPRFKTWNKPIPQSWWYVYRQWLLEQNEAVASS